MGFRRLKICRVYYTYMKMRRAPWLFLLAGILAGLLVVFLVQQTFDHKQASKVSSPSDLREYRPFSKKSKPLVFNPIYPTFDTIFAENHGWVATLSGERVRTIIATGDVSLARQVNIHIQQKQNPNWPFEKTSELLNNSDITFINLENPLIDNCPIATSGFVFCGESSNVNGLLFAGIDVVNFANNHASNYGVDGVGETVRLLRQNNLLVAGVDGPVYKEIDGVTFAFLGYNEVNIQPGVASVNEELIKKEITQARENADVVVVQFHWGAEYVHQPTANQKRLGHLAVDAGADLIIGNHPHWYQAVEFYNDKFIAYSHGNFVFDQMWSQKTREGVVGKYTFFDTELIDVEFIPVLIHDYGQPAVIDELIYRRQIIDTMKQESEVLNY
jgi:poly-gamma-glutamate capsule biosynthesis protein CapA/YwtB (metallophosphatase superfamily)